MLKPVTFLLLGLMALVGCAPLDQSDPDRRNHAMILLQNNGLVPDQHVRTYVEDVGQRIIGATPAANADWDVYVLDTPRVNAYVLGSGSIYMTRGLVALANSEAELAAVMAHEIAHLVAEHSAARSGRMEQVERQVLSETVLADMDDVQRAGNRIASGFAAFTRQQEADADHRGLIYLAKAGYAPQAMVDFLRAMIAHETLEAALAHRRFDPAQANLMSSHPASAARVAAVQAALPTNLTGYMGRDAHLDVIDGLIWGADGRNGLIRGDRWIDPVTGLSITAPAGLSFDVGEIVVRAGDAEGRYISFARDLSRGLTPAAYLTELWLPTMEADDLRGEASEVRNRVINGRETAYVDFPLRSLQGPMTLRFVAVALGREMLEFIMIAPAADRAAMDSLFDTLQTVRILPRSRLDDLSPTRIRVVTAVPGQQINDFIAMMQVDRLARERFLALNNLTAGAQIQAGQRFKILVQ